MRLTLAFIMHFPHFELSLQCFTLYASYNNCIFWVTIILGFAIGIWDLGFKNLGKTLTVVACLKQLVYNNMLGKYEVIVIQDAVLPITFFSTFFSS